MGGNEKNNLVKIVYEDDKKTKVIKGFLLKEDDFTYQVKLLDTNEIRTIGKRALVQMVSIEDKRGYTND